jgi:hypothetical protein
VEVLKAKRPHDDDRRRQHPQRELPATSSLCNGEPRREVGSSAYKDDGVEVNDQLPESPHFTGACDGKA